MARWHKRPPSSPLTLPPFPRVCCHCLCVSTCLVTHTHTHIESSQNGTTLAANNASSTRSCLQGASRVCVYVPAWVSVCVCVVRECGLCHVRHFVTYFLSFVSCVFASFSASLVSGDSSSSSLHVTHTDEHTLLSACVLVLWLSVSQCLCVCVCSRKCYIVFGTQGDTATLSHSRPHSGMHSKAHSLTLTHFCVSISWKKVYGVATPGWLTGVVLLPLLL